MTSSLGRPARAWLPAALLGLWLAAWCPPARAQGRAAGQDPPRTVVIPLRTIGVSDTTAHVVATLIEAELEQRGVPMVASRTLPADLQPGSAACDERDCAIALARSFGAERVVYGSLSRLGDKVIARIRVQRVDEREPDYADQLTAAREDDLDTVARRISEGIATGQPDAQRATMNTITQQETLTPRRRASRAGAGVRAQFLFPADNSYGGADKMSGFRLTGRYEAGGLFVETTPVIGFMWGDQNFEWTILDVHIGRILGTGDTAPYFGAGLGMHSVHVERRYNVYTDPYYGGYPYPSANEQNETTLTGDAGVGMMLFRTYDFSVLLDLRYHVVFSSFDDVGGKGAHGVTLSFGTTR